MYVLAPGDRLLLYTDGLVERRDEPLDKGLDRLSAAAAAADGRELAGWCEALCALAATAGPRDDVALLAVERAV